ncbi:helix-turn-helix domain-containing protein [Streptosporangium sp. NPDC002607]
MSISLTVGCCWPPPVVTSTTRSRRSCSVSSRWPLDRPVERLKPADRTLVAVAREAILQGAPEAVALCSLAGLLKVSPYRLSRVFSQEMGVSLTRYRNRVRVGQAMDRLTRGERGLADLAADLGFADQAHLTRTVREHLGHTPTVLRRLLSARGERRSQNVR